MTRTFLVHLTLSDETNLAFIAEEIEDDLHAAGYDVERVEVWQSPGALGTPTSFSPAPQGPADVPPPNIF